MKPIRLSLRAVSLFLCLVLTLPGPALAMRVESAQQSAGLEELTRSLTGLPEPSPAAGLEETLAKAEEALKTAGVSYPLVPDPVVSQDPALWKEAARQILSMLKQDPAALVKTLTKDYKPVPVGWGLRMGVSQLRGTLKLLPVRADPHREPSTLLGFLESNVRQRIPAILEVEGATKEPPGHLMINREGFFYQAEGRTKRWLLTNSFPYAYGLGEFIQDRGLELLVTIHPEDDTAWEQLGWLLDPRTLRENIPAQTGKDLSLPAPMRGPGERVLAPLLGQISGVREDPQTGLLIPTRFTIRSETRVSFKAYGILALSKEEALLDFYRFGSFRPGHFGWRRPAMVKLLNQWFGEGNWAEKHLVGKLGEQALTWEEAVPFYEEAYFQYFLAHPEELELLLGMASDVYDTALSNIESGTDYKKQETAARHLQDIAIRRVVQRLGKRFRGSEPLEIRGPKSKGFRWNPGNIPFHHPDLILQPALKGWWKPGSVEEFWQSNRVIIPVIERPGLLETLCSNLAVFLSQETLPMESLSPPFWLLPRSAHPDFGRPFVKEKVAATIEKLIQALVHIAPTLPEKFTEKGELDRLKGFKEFPASKDANRVSSHLRYLPLLFDTLRLKKAVPIFLARDALTMYEFGVYAAQLRWREMEGHLLYQPGSPFGSLSRRSREPATDHVLFLTSQIVREIQDELEAKGWITPEVREGKRRDPRIYQELQRRFAEETSALLKEDAVFKTYAERLYRQVQEMAIPPGRPIIVVDTNATGKTALFVKTVVELFSRAEGKPRSVDVLLGWARGKELCVPELRDFGMVTSEPFRDLHWPFFYGGNDPKTGEPVFTVRAGLSRLLYSVFQSVLLYNAAANYVSAAGLEEENGRIKLGKEYGNEAKEIKPSGRGDGVAEFANHQLQRSAPTATQTTRPDIKSTDPIPSVTPSLTLEQHRHNNQRHVKDQADNESGDPKILTQNRSQYESPKHRITRIDDNLQQRFPLLGGEFQHPRRLNHKLTITPFPPPPTSGMSPDSMQSTIYQNISGINKSPAAGLEEADVTREAGLWREHTPSTQYDIPWTIPHGQLSLLLRFAGQPEYLGEYVRRKLEQGQREFTLVFLGSGEREPFTFATYLFWVKEHRDHPGLSPPQRELGRLLDQHQNEVRIRLLAVDKHSRELLPFLEGEEFERISEALGVVRMVNRFLPKIRQTSWLKIEPEETGVMEYIRRGGLQRADGIILNQVLRYLSPSEQVEFWDRLQMLPQELAVVTTDLDDLRSAKLRETGWANGWQLTDLRGGYSWGLRKLAAAGLEEADAILDTLRWRIDLGFELLETGSWELLEKLLDESESSVKQIPLSLKDHDKIRIALLFIDYLRMGWTWHRITSGDSSSAGSYDTDLHVVLQLSDRILKGNLPDTISKAAVQHKLFASSRLLDLNPPFDLSAFEQIATDPLLPKTLSFTALSWAHLKRSSYFEYKLGIPEPALIHLRYALAYGLMAIAVPPDPSLKTSEQEKLLSWGRRNFCSILLWPIPAERMQEVLNELENLPSPEPRIQPVLLDVLSRIQFSSKNAAENLAEDLRKPDWRAVLETSSIAAQVLAETLKQVVLQEPDYQERLRMLKRGERIAELLPEGSDLLLTEDNFREFSKSWLEELKNHPGFPNYPLGRLIYKPEQASGLEEWVEGLERLQEYNEMLMDQVSTLWKSGRRETPLVRVLGGISDSIETLRQGGALAADKLEEMVQSWVDYVYVLTGKRRTADEIGRWLAQPALRESERLDNELDVASAALAVVTNTFQRRHPSPLSAGDFLKELAQFSTLPEPDRELAIRSVLLKIAERAAEVIGYPHPSAAGLEERMVVIAPSAFQQVPGLRRAVGVLKQAGLEGRLIVLPETDLPPEELRNRLVDAATRAYSAGPLIGYAAQDDSVMAGFEELLKPGRVSIVRREPMGLKYFVLQILDDVGISAAGSEEAAEEILSAAGLGQAA